MFYQFFFQILVLLLCLTTKVWGVSLDDNKDVGSESKNSVLQWNRASPKETIPRSNNRNASRNTVLEQSLIQKNLEDNTQQKKSSADKPIVGADSTELYLFEQDELEVQKPSLELYEILEPMLSSELKQDAKKTWSETADLRESINFSTKSLDSKELTIKQATQEMTQLKARKLAALSSGKFDKDDLDQSKVRALFDDFYDLLKNAFFIIVTVLVIGKIVSHIFSKITKKPTKRKKKRRKKRISRVDGVYRRKRRRIRV